MHLSLCSVFRSSNIHVSQEGSADDVDEDDNPSVSDYSYCFYAKAVVHSESLLPFNLTLQKSSKSRRVGNCVTAAILR